MFSKKATKIEEIFTVDLTLCSKQKINGEDFVNFCGLPRKHELYAKEFYGLKRRSNFSTTLCFWVARVFQQRESCLEGSQKLEAIIKLTIYPNVFDYSTPIVSTITEKRAIATLAPHCAFLGNHKVVIKSWNMTIYQCSSRSLCTQQLAPARLLAITIA